MLFRVIGILKVAALVSAFLLTVFLTFHLLDINMDFNLSSMMTKSMRVAEVSMKPDKEKCNLSKACPPRHFAFKMTSGAANVVGPRICLEDVIIMSNVKNNVGRGLNVVLVHGKTGEVFMTTTFDLWGGDVQLFITFLKQITEGTIVMMASYDDMSTKLNDEAKQLIADLGSTEIRNVGERDNWIFVGGKGIKTKTPFEQYIKSNKETNKFEGWPAVLEMEGCIPSKQH